MAKRYPCPCCGYLTLPQPAPGSWEICPVCFWEDSPEDWDWNSNGVYLEQGQANFEKLGACGPGWISDVRPPTPDEARLPGWQSLAEQEPECRQTLIETIAEAFADVLREDGVSLHQARVIDAYGGPAEEAQARLLDTDGHWWEVPDERIAELYEALSFVDPKGFRYYIPAYMIWTLKHYRSTDSNSVDSTVYAFLIYGGLEEWTQTRFEILNQPQRRAVCWFLQYIVRFGRRYADTPSAQLALDQYWGQFCSPELPLGGFPKNP